VLVGVVVTASVVVDAGAAVVVLTVVGGGGDGEGRTVLVGSSGIGGVEPRLEAVSSPCADSTAGVSTGSVGFVSDIYEDCWWKKRDENCGRGNVTWQPLNHVSHLNAFLYETMTIENNVPEMGRHLRQIVDNSFEEGQFESAIAMLDTLRSPVHRPSM